MPARKPAWQPGKAALLGACRLEGGDVDPGVLGVAFELRFEEREATEAVGEGRVFGGRGRVEDRRVEAAEDLLEGVVVAFAVPAREIGVGAGALFEQRGIL